MLDRFDAAFYYGHNNHAYFFRGDKYIKYKPGDGVVRENGQILRTLGVSGWSGLPPTFMQGIDAALYYPKDGVWSVYFFKGNQYVKFRPGDGVDTSTGSAIRTIGQTGWQDFPPSFQQGIDAAFYYHDNHAAYFFKGNRYIKYIPGRGVDGEVRTIGVTGWQGLPPAFRQKVDAVFDYSTQDQDGKVSSAKETYFFSGRDYVKWLPNQGVAPRYPRKIGLLHRARGGFPGTSHLLGGPTLGPVDTSTARIWVWASSAEDVERMRLLLDGVEHPFTTFAPAGPIAEAGIAAIQAHSVIRALDVANLTPSTPYHGKLFHGTTELDAFSFTTAPVELTTGSVTVVFGSCARVDADQPDVPAFQAMADVKADLALFIGDNCYYLNDRGTTHVELEHRPGSPVAMVVPADWDRPDRMLVRHLVVRNHPQLAALARSTPMYATWDDHDFGPNNVDGAVHPALRERATQVHKAMWPAPYPSSDVRSSFRHGPVEIFLTDDRFHKDAEHHHIWGEEQTVQLLAAVASSSAPVRIVVVATQFLGAHEEGHAKEAKPERLDFLARFASTSRPILIVSGDVHHSALFRLEGAERTWLVEQTSSPLRCGDLVSPRELTGTRNTWGHRGESFGVLRIEITGAVPDGRVTGHITHELRDPSGKVVHTTTWDPAVGFA